MAKLDLREYARRGAQARAIELRAELASIYRTFPELRRAESAGVAERKPSRRARGRRKPMTDAQKKAVGVRMRKYWAARRKDKGKAA